MVNIKTLSNRVVNSPKFLTMPTSTQVLYFHLIASADKTGKVEVFPVMRIIGASEDDLKILTDREFITDNDE